MDLSYRIVSSQIIVLYRLRTRLSSLIVSCIIVLYWSLFYRATAARWPDGEFIKLSEIIASKPKPYRIVSHRIVLAGLSSLSVSRVIANRTYRKVSYRHLSCTYRIVSYRQIQGHVLMFWTNRPPLVCDICFPFV